MKSEKAITLTSLVIYVTIFTIILATMSTIINFFYRNIADVKEPLKYVLEFNKFSMLFIQDVKKNKSAVITANQVKFEDGTIYEYRSNEVYRNDVKIAQNIKQLQFTSSTYVVGEVTKNLINVNMTLGNRKEEVIRSIDFVLRYW